MIEEGKIIQVWDKKIDDVIIYSQTIANTYTKEKIELRALSLKELEIQVSNQKKKWENRI